MLPLKIVGRWFISFCGPYFQDSKLAVGRRRDDLDEIVPFLRPFCWVRWKPSPMTQRHLGAEEEFDSRTLTQKKWKKLGWNQTNQTPQVIYLFLFLNYITDEIVSFLWVTPFFQHFLLHFTLPWFTWEEVLVSFLNEFTEKYCETLPSFSPFLRSPEILRSKMEQTLRLSGHVMQGNGMGWSKFSAKNFFRSHFERTKWKAPENKPSQKESRLPTIHFQVLS